MNRNESRVLKLLFENSKMPISEISDRPTINTGISNESPNATVYINIKDTKLDIPIVTSAPTPMSKLAKILNRIGAMK